MRKSNYIHRLQDQVEDLETDKAEALAELTALRAYIASSKFRHGSPLDGYVNVQDVETRVLAAMASLYSTAAPSGQSRAG